MKKRSNTIVGIDLGTTNSCIAVSKGGKVYPIPDQQKRTIHPSVVSFAREDKVLVAHEAKKYQLLDPVNTIFSAKRLLGRSFESEEVKFCVAKFPYIIREGPNRSPVVVVKDNEYLITEIISFILQYLKDLASSYMKEEIFKAIITVPANFNEVQRSCTKLAGERVGLEVVRVLNEPTAAALAYGFEQGLEERIAIYDFGGGTFDITLLELKGDIFEVLATAGDSFLGGDDIDLRLVEYMISAFMKLYHYDLRGDELAIQRLTQVAEQIKCQLSASSKTKVHIKELAYGENNQPLDLIFSITRSGFYARISDIVDRTFKVADEAFKIAGIEPQDIDKVILVGGSTRMPLVREKVKGYFSKEPLCHLDPDQVVALGAAIYGEVLTEKSKTVEKKTLKGIPALASPGKPSFKSAQIPPPPRALLLDVTPRTLGIATVGGYCDHIIERNAAIPVEQTRVFTTSRDFQTEVKIIITQGESRRIEENMILGELELKDLKPAPRGEVKIEVTFEIDVNGIIQIKARDQETGKEQKVKLTIHGTLSEEELEKFTRKRESSTVEPLKNLVK